MTAQPEAPSTDAPSAEDRTQLRIGLVMTGGVSLCVWMGGVAYELDRLRRLDDSTYRALADFAGVEPVIDVIGGTSAGGLNGVLLASGIAWDSTIESLRDLWLTLADFSELLRSPDEAKPPSLLKGDAYFLKGVQRALEAIEASKALNPARVPRPKVHAIITTTLPVAVTHSRVDATGATVAETTNLGLFHFDEGRGDFAVDAGPGVIARLARAARSSASFPVAFEPSFVSVGTADVDGADMASVADFTVNRFALDGGLMDNEPIDQVLSVIAEQPSSGPVRRVVMLVTPFGGPLCSDAPQNATDAPSIWQVLHDTLIVPREQSIAGAVDRLTQRASLHTRIQTVRRDLFAGPDGDLAGRARALHEVAASMRPALEMLRRDDKRQRHPAAAPTGTEVAQVRQNLLIVQDLLRRALVSVPAGSGLVEEVKSARASVSAAIHALRKDASDALWDAATTDALELLWGKVLPQVGPPYGEQLRVEIGGLRALAQVTAPASDALTAADWMQALTDLDTLQSVATNGLTDNPQQIDYEEITGDTPSAVGIDRDSSKLIGRQLMHFGAFYQASWRESDWIWGRLDGSFRLAAYLADPTHLLAIHGSADAVASGLARALGKGDDYREALLRQLKVVEADASTTSGDRVRAARIAFTKIVVRDLHAAILREELPVLRAKAAHDFDPHTKDQARYQNTVAAIDRYLALPVDQQELVDNIAAAWNGCQLTECLFPSGEFGSDQLAQTATDTAAVAAGIFQGARLPQPVKTIVVPLRRALQFASFLASPASTSKTSQLIVGLVALIGTLAALAWASSVGAFWGVVALVVWLPIVVVGIMLRNWARLIGAVVLLLATVGLGLAGDHWDRVDLVILGAGVGVVAAFVGTFACSRRPPPPLPAMPKAGT